MTYVTVYLVDAKRNIVVPENWVKDLNNAKLKNNGRNSNQDFLTYWSAENGQANFELQPDFASRLVKEYFPSTCGVCYICRVKTFFDVYENALEYVEKRRPITPPAYNERREHEQPIPDILQPLNFVNLENLNVTEGNSNNTDPLAQSFVENSLELYNGIAHSTAIQNHDDEPTTNESLVTADLLEAQFHEERSETTNQLNVGDDPFLVEIKEEPSVDLNDSDIEELQALLQYAEENDTSFEIISDELMVQRLDVYPKPINPQFEVKENDILCGNIAFKAYSNGTRGFLAMTKPNVTEIRLNDETVKVLIKWNEGRSRRSTIIDKLFVEYLLISLIGTEKIKENDIDENILATIKDLFKNRVEDAEDRLNKFDKIVESKCKGVGSQPLQQKQPQNKKSDRISGGLAFETLANGSRIYTILNKRVEIPKKMIEQFIVWTTSPYNLEKKVDDRMTKSLLVILEAAFGFDQNSMPDEVGNFIRSFVSVRANGEESRVLEVNKYVEEFWTKK